MFESIELINQVLSEAGFPKKSVLSNEPLNIEYESFSFYIDQKQYRHRRSKRTPNKKGYFSVFWIKDENNNNRPYTFEETPEKLIITVIDKNQSGQFIFPREVLLNRGVLKSETCKGKMAMRVYPDWETDLNKTAAKTQKWQSEYFIDLSYEINKERILNLY